MCIWATFVYEKADALKGFLCMENLSGARKKKDLEQQWSLAKAGAAQQCHNFCGWLPNAVPLLRQIALLNYVLQNILCKRPLLWGIDIKQSHCLKIIQNVAFQFWPFPPIFVLLKLTCLVTLFDRKLQFLKNSPKWTIFGIFN